MYIKSSIRATRREDPSPTIVEKRVHIGVCYRPPDQTAELRETFLNDFENVIDMVLSENLKILVFEAFNDRCTKIFS